MQTYTSYKPSNIEWIGEIPSHWEKSKLKFITDLIVDGTHHTPEYTDYGIPFLRVTDVQSNIIDFDSIKYISEVEHKELIKRCKPQKGDILLSKNGTIGKTKIVTWDWEFSIFVSLCLIRFKPLFNTKLFSYLFQSSIIDQQISESSKQSTVTNLHLDKIRELIIITPPLQEQQAIVNYLDHKTALIDELIIKKEKKIELLKEQRSALINHVVTKGLNPDAPMKNSGIDWIGEIPEHWERQPLKYFAKITLGKMLTPEDNGGMLLKPYLRSQNVQNEKVDVFDVKEMWFSKRELSIYKLDLNDLLINEGGDVGRTCIWNNELEECYIQNSVNRVKICNGFSRYFLYHSVSYHQNKFYENCVNRVSIPHLTKEKLENILFITPPYLEQQEIAKYLDLQTTIIDKSIEIEIQKIEKLKEYRQSLISNVVTGKIKVF